MPYITEADRTEIEKGRCASTAGELNYAITKLILDYLGKNASYAKINEVVGALECCKLEFYRRCAAPYEETCIIRNGDVYPL